MARRVKLTAPSNVRSPTRRLTLAEEGRPEDETVTAPRTGGGAGWDIVTAGAFVAVAGARMTLIELSAAVTSGNAVKSFCDGESFSKANRTEHIASWPREQFRNCMSMLGALTWDTTHSDALAVGCYEDAGELGAADGEQRFDRLTEHGLLHC